MPVIFISKSLDDTLRNEASCTTELDYTEQTSWLLCLKYLDELVCEKAIAAELEWRNYGFILDRQFRWNRWAAPKVRHGRCITAGQWPVMKCSTS